MPSPRHQVRSRRGLCWRSLGGETVEGAMNTSPWKRLLQEPNALGWLVFLVLVFAIGAGALYFGPPDTERTLSEKPASTEQAAR